MAEPIACLVCAAPLEYLSRPETLCCAFCGKESLSNVRCENGHFICDDCHRKGALTKASRAACDMESADPIAIVQSYMEWPETHMNGPEHHVLVPMALLVAYRAAGGDIDLAPALAEAMRRGEKVPGGACGFAGCCGAAVGAGIFLSIVLETSPTKKGHYDEVNRMTARCLSRIADAGGPRCCKRNGFLAIEEAVRFTEEVTGISMDLPATVHCAHHERNRECIGRACPYFPD